MRAKSPKVSGPYWHSSRFPGGSGYLNPTVSSISGPIFYSTPRPTLHGLIACHIDHGCYRRIGGVRWKFSLAERIKSFLPEDALEKGTESEHEYLSDEEFDEPMIEPLASLAAFESEVLKAEKLIQSCAYDEASIYIINNMPLPVALTALVERIAPLIRSSSMSDIGSVEFGYHLFKAGNLGSARQFLHEARISGSTKMFEIILHLENRTKESEEHPWKVDTRFIDVFISELSPGQHFPQLLSQLSGTIPLTMWFKTRSSASLPWRECEKWINRYRNQSRSSGDTSFVSLSFSSTSHLPDLIKWVINYHAEDLPESIPSARSPQQLHLFSRPLLRPSRIPILKEEVVVALLKASIRQKQSYDVANICYRSEPMLVANRANYSFVADASSAVAFAQKRTPDLMSSEITCGSDKLRSRLVTMVLPNNSNIANDVIGLAARKLLNRSKQRKVPGHALWQLLLSSPVNISLNKYAQSELSKLLGRRPYVEQVRYMALPFVNPLGIKQLLRWHIVRIIEHRRRHNVNWNTLQAKEDVQSLVAGMMIAAEKSKQFHTQKDSDKLDEIVQIFEKGEYNDTAAVLDALTSDVEHFSAGLAMQVIAELVSQKHYIVAQQMLRMLGPERLSRSTFDTLLLGLAEACPVESYFFVTWLIAENPRSVSYKTVNEVLYVLINEKSLSESQLMNRFQALRQLISSKMHREVASEPAKAFVDALISSSKERKGGSRMRSKWALEVAQKSGVNEKVFEQWTNELKEMNLRREGFWYNT